jgi:hypothetical protein
MNRRELIAAMMTATVASPLVPVLAGETELPVKTVEEIEAEFAAEIKRMLADGTITVILTN